MTNRPSFHLIAIAFATALTAGAAAAQDRHVVIHNDTGYTLYHFYSTNSGSTKWGSDILGSSTLPDGAAVRMNFDNAYGYCEFDFRAVFEDGSELQRANINVCEIGDYYYTP
jgi:hypothetical protein